MRFARLALLPTALSFVYLATPKTAGAQDSTVNVGQDFTPGTRVIWASDFATDPIGDFPRRIELGQGNFETAGWNGKRWVRTTSGGVIVVHLPEALPQRATVEFDYAGGTGWSMEVQLKDPNSDGGLGRLQFSTSGDAGILGGTGGADASSSVGDFTGQVIHCEIMVDGDYAKVYINGKRAAQVPKANLGRSNKIYFSFTADADTPAYMSNIRVAAGGKNMYEALASEGRFTTRGILFDTGSDDIKPESSPALTEIGQMLQQHADLRIEIDASRLSSKGFGSSRPVASNDTADGRQQNRRVELVKM